jgi:hypothetical protein
MSQYAYSERSRRAMNARASRSLEKEKERAEANKTRTSWPTIPCCDAMRAGLACDCCEVVDA